jgi:hypothetical protein
VKVGAHFLKTATVVAASVVVTVVAAASVSAKPEKLTAATAKAKAEAALLAPSDFGADWTEDTVTLPEQTYSEMGLEAGCSKADAAALSSGAKRGRGEAGRFVKKGHDNANFAVAVHADVKGAKGYMQRARTRSFQECTNKADELFTERTFPFGKVTVTKTQEKLRGLDAGDDALGYRCTFALAGDVNLDAHVFCYELRGGRAIASINFPASIPTAEQQRLLDLFAAKLKKV